MHYRMIVLTPKEVAENSEEARSYVNNWLDDNGFCGSGRFSSGMADWFVIGGRWSGELTRSRLDQEKLKACDDEFEKEFGWFTGGKEQVTALQRAVQYKGVFLKYFPKFKGMTPAWRDQYKQDGFEDDAQIVDKELWDKLIKEVSKDGDGEGFLYTEEEGVILKEEAVVGNMWAVVVDYHN